MKQLVCEEEIRKLIVAGEKVCIIDENAIITPAARDAANSAGIRFEKRVADKPTAIDTVCSQNRSSEVTEQEIAELFKKIIKMLIDQGRIDSDFLERLSRTLGSSSR